MEFESGTVSMEKDMSDESRLKLFIQGFYEIASTINENNHEDVLDRLTAATNVILSMMHTYLCKFNNQLILDDYINAMKKTINDHQDKTNNPFFVYHGIVETVSIFLGLQENISDKLAEQLFEQWKEWESDLND